MSHMASSVALATLTLTRTSNPNPIKLLPFGISSCRAHLPQHGRFHPILLPPRVFARKTAPSHTSKGSIPAAGSELSGNGEACSPSLIQQLIEFLEEDLTHLFDERGITKEQYEEGVEFRDPITKYDSIDGYLFNIQMLRYLFRPVFDLHYVKQTGPCEITTRWTMTMKVSILPWKPEMVFTGVSLMGINPRTGKFISHVDLWDSVRNNEYFSLEAAVDFIRQLRYFKTPDIETPKYKVLKRTSTYEIRKYEPFIVVEAQGDQLTGNKGFKNVTDYIFGNNSKGEKIQMTTPVITSTPSEASTDISIQIVLPLQSQLPSLPSPINDAVRLREVSGDYLAALKFSGDTVEEIAKQKEETLRSALVADGLKPKPGFMLARYNDPGRTKPSIRRNEVLIRVDGFKLEG